MNTNDIKKRRVSSPDANPRPYNGGVRSDKEGDLTVSVRNMRSKVQKTIENMAPSGDRKAGPAGRKAVVHRTSEKKGIQYGDDCSGDIASLHAASNGTRHFKKANVNNKHGKYPVNVYTHPGFNVFHTHEHIDSQPVADKDSVYIKRSVIKIIVPIAVLIIMLTIVFPIHNHETDENTANFTPEGQTQVSPVETGQSGAEPSANELVSLSDNSSTGLDENSIEALKASAFIWADPESPQYGLEYGVYVGTARDMSYHRDNPVYFDTAFSYTDLEGVITFRGSNMRQNAFYGAAELSEKRLSKAWSVRIGGFDTGWTNWTGVGWNGQPVIVKWPAGLRCIMNLYDQYKNDDDLVEVIQGALDGNIYFLDLYTGKKTRPPIELGYPIKGSVSIDPRGYPLLYVGQGISKVQGQKPGEIGWHIYSLIDQSHLYMLNGRDEFSFRTDHGSFDGVCLIDAETDTVITGGENGIFYSVKLNTGFDIDAGTISIDPEVTRYRYKSKITKSVGSEGLGIENSVAAYGNYAWFADNAGQMTCLDLNTLKPVWVFDLGDDTDSTTALEDEGGGILSLYTLNQVDKQGESGICTVRKLNALTGEQLWSFDVSCTSDGVNGGGGFASPAIGANGLSDYVYFNVARTGGGSALYCVDKKIGKIRWQKSVPWNSWSTPVLIYDKNGDGYLIVGNSGGTLRLYGGNTGRLYNELKLDGKMEASPAVFNNMLVIGTRDMWIYGIKIK